MPSPRDELVQQPVPVQRFLERVAADVRHGRRQGDFFKVQTVLERARADGFRSVAEKYGAQFLVVGERFIADVRHAVGQRNVVAGKRGTECARPDLLHAVADGQLFDIHILERLLADRAHRPGDGKRADRLRASRI